MNFLIKNSSKISLKEIWLSKTPTNRVFDLISVFQATKMPLTCQQKDNGN